MAGASLMTPFLDAVGCDPANAYRLDPLPHMLRKGRLSRRYPAAVREKARAWCERIGALEGAPSAEVHQQLIDVVDPGEALLLATVVEIEGGVVATGDKSACLAVATASSLSALRPQLTGRVLCMERALDLLLGKLGFGKLSVALAAVREFNQTLRVLLPEATATDEAHFRQGLTSYLSNLERQAGPILYSPP